jgi:hypothetical protein
MKFVYLATRSPSMLVVKISLYNQPLRVTRPTLTFSRTTCPAKNMLPALAGNEK